MSDAMKTNMDKLEQVANQAVDTLPAEIIDRAFERAADYLQGAMDNAKREAS